MKFIHMFRFSKRHKEYLTTDSTFEAKMPPHLENRIGTFRSVLAQLQREKQFPAFQVRKCYYILIILDGAFNDYKNLK